MLRLRLRERADLLAGEHGIEITLLLRAGERQQNRTGHRTEQRVIPRRYRRGAGNLVPKHRHAGEPETLAAQFLGYGQQPEAGVLCLPLYGQAVRSRHGAPLERHQFTFDEAAQAAPELVEFGYRHCRRLHFRQEATALHARPWSGGMLPGSVR